MEVLEWDRTKCPLEIAFQRVYTFSEVSLLSDLPPAFISSVTILPSIVRSGNVVSFFTFLLKMTSTVSPSNTVYCVFSNPWTVR